MHLQAEGRRIRRYEPSRIQFKWSDDLHSLTYDHKTLHVKDYRLWVHKVIAKAERQLRALFAGEQPPKLPPLKSLRETLTGRTAGEAFFTLP